jgi:hypothetical protein
MDLRLWLAHHEANDRDRRRAAQVSDEVAFQAEP